MAKPRTWLFVVLGLLALFLVGAIVVVGQARGSSPAT